MPAAASTSRTRTTARFARAHAGVLRAVASGIGARARQCASRSRSSQYLRGEPATCGGSIAMPETVETTEAGTSASEDETSKYASLLATDERVLLVRQRHWLTVLEAGRWFVLAIGVGVAALLLDQGVSDNGIAGFFSSLLNWGFWILLAIGLLGVGWYYLVWRVERYLVTTRRVIEAGGVINKY